MSLSASGYLPLLEQPTAIRQDFVLRDHEQQWQARHHIDFRMILLWSS